METPITTGKRGAGAGTVGGAEDQHHPHRTTTTKAT
jgi:hypothetical protein